MVLMSLLALDSARKFMSPTLSSRDQERLTTSFLTDRISFTLLDQRAYRLGMVTQLTTRDLLTWKR